MRVREVRSRRRGTPPLLNSRSIVIRGGSGFGDSLYLQSVVRYFLSKGLMVEACTNWPDIFAQLTGPLTIAPFRRDRVNRLATYTQRKSIAGTSQFQDCCLAAGIREPVEFALGWVPRPTSLTRRLMRESRPVICVNLARNPMGRSDGFGAEVAPDWRRVQDALDALGKRAFLIQVGSGESLYRFNGINLDMANCTSVADVLDIAAIANGFLGYCSFMVPLAESQSKPALFVWSQRGLRSSDRFVSSINPQKVLHRESSRYVLDDCGSREMVEAVDAFFEQARSPQVV
jgi:hypothetical protein